MNPQLTLVSTQATSRALSSQPAQFYLFLHLFLQYLAVFLSPDLCPISCTCLTATTWWVCSAATRAWESTKEIGRDTYKWERWSYEHLAGSAEFSTEIDASGRIPALFHVQHCCAGCCCGVATLSCLPSYELPDGAYQEEEVIPVV